MDRPGFQHCIERAAQDDKIWRDPGTLQKHNINNNNDEAHTAEHIMIMIIERHKIKDLCLTLVVSQRFITMVYFSQN